MGFMFKITTRFLKRIKCFPWRFETIKFKKQSLITQIQHNVMFTIKPKAARGKVSLLGASAWYIWFKYEKFAFGCETTFLILICIILLINNCLCFCFYR
jgi:hypothetical protein